MAKKKTATKVKPSKTEKTKKLTTPVKSPSRAVSKSISKVAGKAVAPLKTVKKAAPVVENFKPDLMKKRVENNPLRRSIGTNKTKEVAEKGTGNTLIEMAKEEMAAVKIGQTAEKLEKAAKLKPIKVERGNLADEKVKWQELYKRYGKEKAAVYKMTDVFESIKPIQHKVLGWGFVLTNDNDRLEVLFENGIKMLISNYKSN